MEPAHSGLPNVVVASNDPDDHHITADTKLLSVMFAGYDPARRQDDIVCVIINPFWEDQHVRLPALPSGLCWGISIDTADRNGHAYRERPSYMSDVILKAAARSVMVFTGMPEPIDYHI